MYLAFIRQHVTPKCSFSWQEHFEKTQCILQLQGLIPLKVWYHINSGDFYWLEQMHYQRNEKGEHVARKGQHEQFHSLYVFRIYAAPFAASYLNETRNTVLAVSGNQRSAPHHYSITLQLGSCSAHNCFGYLKHKLWYPFSVKKDLCSKRIDAAEPGLFCSTGFSIPFPQWGPCRSLTRQGHCRSCSTQTQPKEPTWKLSSIIVLSVKEWDYPWDHKLAILTLVFLWLFCS